jgi:hypothetical protein
MWRMRNLGGEYCMIIKLVKHFVTPWPKRIELIDRYLSNTPLSVTGNQTPNKEAPNTHPNVSPV